MDKKDHLKEAPQKVSEALEKVPQKQTPRAVLALVGALILIIGLIAGYYFAQSSKPIANSQITPSPILSPEAGDGMEGWETYVNKEYGFQMHYPSAWSVQEYQPVERKLFGIIIFGERGESDKNPSSELADGAKIAIGQPESIDIDLNVWIKNKFSTYPNSPTNTKFSSVVINNNHYQTVSSCGLGCFTYYILEKDGLVYQIITFAEGPNKTDFQKTIDQILSTFEFTNANENTYTGPSSDEMVGWKTYKNEKYQFSFKYPYNFELHDNADLAGGVTARLKLGTNIEITVRDPKIPKEDILRNWKDYQEIQLRYVKGYREESISAAIGGNPPYLKHEQYLVDTQKINIFINFSENNEGELAQYRSDLDQILSTFEFVK